MSEAQPTRREVLRRAVYVTPLIITLPVLPSFASEGSGNHQNHNKQLFNRRRRYQEVDKSDDRDNSSRS